MYHDPDLGAEHRAAGAIEQLLASRAQLLRLPGRLGLLYEKKTDALRRRTMRFAIWLAIALAVACLPLDALLGSAHFELGVLLRIGVIVPVAALSLFVLRHRRLQWIAGAAAIAPMLVTVAVVTILGLSLPIVYGDRYLMAAAFIVVAVNIVVPLRPSHGFVFALASFVLFAGLIAFGRGGPLMAHADLYVMMALAGAFSLAINLRQDRNNKRAFLMAMKDRSNQLQLRAMNDELRLLSATDPLTGLHNRRHFETAFAEAWEASLSSGAWLSVMIVDIDHFKRFNDRYGHASGDECLKEVADLLDTAIGDDGLVARYGGEEFVAFLPGHAPEECRSRGEKMCSAISRTRIALPEGKGRAGVTVSIGFASIEPAERLARDDLLLLADKALYEAKEKGRNRVVGCNDNRRKARSFADRLFADRRLAS